MCGRYMLDSDIEDILRQYKILRNGVEDYRRGEIFPSQDAPIVFGNKDRTLKSARWGFPLTGKKSLVINARSESIDSKPMFRDSFNNSRCIIPANLFYEWKEEGPKNKVKHRIYLKDKKIASLGGILKLTPNEKGEKILSFVIITTESNKYMKDLHTRMPLILEEEHFDYWLDSSTSKNTLEEIMNENIKHVLDIEREDQPFEQMKLF